MENKQTAVEFLIEHIKLDAMYEAKSIDEWVNIFKQAKAIEKEQHDLTFARGVMTGYANANGYESVDFEQYYEKTYGK